MLASPYVLSTTEAPLHPIAVVKSVSCYRHQSCEHPGWAASAAHELCAALIARAEQDLPASDKVPVRFLGTTVPTYQAGAPFQQMPWPFEDSYTGRYRRLSAVQYEVNTAHARQRGQGERVNAELKNWKILRKIRSCPTRAADLVAAVQTLMIASA